MVDSNSLSLRVAVQHCLPVVNAGIVAMLSRHPDVRVVSERPLDDGPEVIIADYDGGLSRAAMNSTRDRHAPLLIVTGTDRETDVRRALHAGIGGYVLYDCAPDELTSAVLALGRGDRHFCARVVSRMADSLTHDELTPRELDVLSLMMKGFNNKSIARELHVSIGTVKAHANAVYGKLNATSRLQAVVVAAARGIGAVVPIDHVAASNPAFSARRSGTNAGAFAGM
jgi:DNA-binding NarL/FixJ family response regulator